MDLLRYRLDRIISASKDLSGLEENLTAAFGPKHAARDRSWFTHPGAEPDDGSGFEISITCPNENGCEVLVWYNCQPDEVYDSVLHRFNSDATD
jgi:hypothetical protein